jgi:hypothetical protein
MNHARLGDCSPAADSREYSVKTCQGNGIDRAGVAGPCISGRGWGGITRFVRTDGTIENNWTSPERGNALHHGESSANAVPNGRRWMTL